LTAHVLSAEIVDGPVPLVRVGGELDISTVAQLCRAIHVAATGAVRPPRLIVDLTALTFCDSTGLRALIGASTELRVSGGRLAIACLSGGPVGRLFDIVGARETLRVHDTADAALASLGVLRA
jgi:anti-sigma B factor antagonist